MPHKRLKVAERQVVLPSVHLFKPNLTAKLPAELTKRKLSQRQHWFVNFMNNNMKTLTSIEPPERTILHAIAIQRQLDIIRARRIKKEGKFARSGQSEGLSPADIATAIMGGSSEDIDEEIGDGELRAEGTDDDEFMDSFDASAQGSYDEPTPGAAELDLSDNSAGIPDSLDTTQPGHASGIEPYDPGGTADDDFMSSLCSGPEPATVGGGNTVPARVSESPKAQLPIHRVKESQQLETVVLPNDLNNLLKDIRGHR